MKQILIALAMMGIACSGAEAQNRMAKNACMVKHVTAKHVMAKKIVYRHKLRDVSYVKNYQVCTENGGYYTCCLHQQTITERQ